MLTTSTVSSTGRDLKSRRDSPCPQLTDLTIPSIPSLYYKLEEDDLMSAFICSSKASNGMHKCVNLPRYKEAGRTCSLTVEERREGRAGCVDWNQYYTTCTTGPTNPFHGAVSFDNIGLAWVAIFLVISLEGWTDVMYFVQDSHSFWNWIYFVCLIVVLSHRLLFSFLSLPFRSGHSS